MSPLSVNSGHEVGHFGGQVAHGQRLNGRILSPQTPPSIKRREFAAKEFCRFVQWASGRHFGLVSDRYQHPEHIQVIKEALAAMRMSACYHHQRSRPIPARRRTQGAVFRGGESPALLALHQAIGSSLTAAIGFQPEDRPYSPHITLAHINAPAPPGIVDRYLEQNRGFQVAPVLVRQIALYSSVRSEEVPQYQEEAVFDLHEQV